MASQPVKRDMVHRIALKAQEELTDLPPDLPTDDKALAYVCALLEQGTRISHIAPSFGVSRFLLDRWIRETPERKAEVSRARALGADALVDEGGDLLDTATKDTIQVANARAGWRKWLASKYDPATYGEGQQVQPHGVHLHLHAALSGPVALPPLNRESPPLLGSPASGGVGGYPTASGRAFPTESEPLLPRESGVEIGTLPPVSQGPPLESNGGNG